VVGAYSSSRVRSVGRASRGRFWRLGASFLAAGGVAVALERELWRRCGRDLGKPASRCARLQPVVVDPFFVRGGVDGVNGVPSSGVGPSFRAGRCSGGVAHPLEQLDAVRRGIFLVGQGTRSMGRPPKIFRGAASAESAVILQKVSAASQAARSGEKKLCRARRRRQESYNLGLTVNQKTASHGGTPPPGRRAQAAARAMQSGTIHFCYSPRPSMSKMGGRRARTGPGDGAEEGARGGQPLPGRWPARRRAGAHGPPEGWCGVPGFSGRQARRERDRPGFQQKRLVIRDFSVAVRQREVSTVAVSRWEARLRVRGRRRDGSAGLFLSRVRPHQQTPSPHTPPPRPRPPGAD